MIEGIVASIIAAVVGAISVAAYRYSWLSGLVDLLLITLGKSTVRRIGGAPPTVGKLQKLIIRLLLADQSLIGVHKGQFGKSTSLSVLKKWQTQGSRENVSIKPRIYLTYWPTLILQRHNLKKRSVGLARLSIQNLFSNNRILVAQSAAPNMAPDREPVIVSYRHTMAGSLILAAFESWNPTTRATLDAMIDPKNDWQKSNGGWRQVSDHFNTADLWASAYAVELLDKCLSPSSPFSKAEQTRAEQLLISTLSFFEEHWAKKHWAFGKLTAGEAAVPLYINLVQVLAQWKPSMAADCLKVFESWLSHSGDLSDSYKAKLDGWPSEQLYARMAYAFYLGDIDSNIWKILFEKLVQGDLTKLYSSGLSFTLDMSFAYSNDANKKIQPTSFVVG